MASIENNETKWRAGASFIRSVHRQKKCLLNELLLSLASSKGQDQIGLFFLEREKERELMNI